MKYLVLALPFFALPFTAWGEDDAPLPTSLSLDVPCVQQRPSEAPPQEEERMRLEGGDSLPVMDYIYRYSELEAGVFYTDWATKLQLDNHVGGYVRWSVAVNPYVNANLAFRYAAYDNAKVTGREDEHVLERGLLAGVGVRVPLTRDFAATGNASIGFMRFDSRAANIGSDTGPAFALEGALTAKIWEMLRLKAGVGADFIRTDFHQTSADWAINLTYLVGVEIGM
jgi:hypothetical protein